MFRITQNLWIDQVRAEKVRGDAVDIELIDDLFNCDGPGAAVSRLTLQEVMNDIAQLSTEQRDVIKLVCLYNMTYNDAGKILNLPVGTVMSRLARARVALLEARREARSSTEPPSACLVTIKGK